MKQLETTNIVLTRISGGVSMPIFSCEKGIKGATTLIHAKMSAAMLDAERSGGVTDFRITEEYRKANPDGTVLIKEVIKELDPDTMKPIPEDA